MCGVCVLYYMRVWREGVSAITIERLLLFSETHITFRMSAVFKFSSSAPSSSRHGLHTSADWSCESRTKRLFREPVQSPGLA